MPRDPSFIYTLPSAPFVANTVASPTPVNANFTDIANALTDSLTRGETTAFTRDLLNDADAAAARTTLGVNIKHEWVATSAAIAGGPTWIEFALPAGFVAFEFRALGVAPAIADRPLVFQLSNNGGTSWISGVADYTWGAQSFNNSGSGPTPPTTSNTALASFPQQSSAALSALSTIFLSMPDTAGHHEYHVNATNTETTGWRGGLIAGGLTVSATRADRIRFAWDTATFQNRGLIIMHGLRA